MSSGLVPVIQYVNAKGFKFGLVTIYAASMCPLLAMDCHDIAIFSTQTEASTRATREEGHTTFRVAMVGFHAKGLSSWW